MEPLEIIKEQLERLNDSLQNEYIDSEQYVQLIQEIHEMLFKVIEQQISQPAKYFGEIKA